MIENRFEERHYVYFLYGFFLQSSEGYGENMTLGKNQDIHRAG